MLPKAGQKGWALLGMLLAITIMSIMLMGVMPSVQMEVKRDKEAEMIFRGQEMAEAIARYYNFGRLGPINLAIAPPYGYLTDIHKLRDGVTVGVTELRFARPSALIDPMVGKEWIPIRARDPRLMPALQAYAAANMLTIPPSYMILAAAPMVTHNASGFGSGFGSSSSSSSGFGSTSGGSSRGFGSTGSTGSSGTTGSTDGGQGQGQGQGQITTQPSPQPGQPQTGRPRQNTQADDDDDDDDMGTVDPLASLMQGDKSNLPIVAVAPNLKGASVHQLWGLKDYKDWIFIYIPAPALRIQPNNPTQQQQPTSGSSTLKVNP